MFDTELRSAGATLIVGSVTDSTDVEGAMRGCDLVYHLASPFGDILSLTACTGTSRSMEPGMFSRLPSGSECEEWFTAARRACTAHYRAARR